MDIEHRRPLVAYVVCAVLCAVVLAQPWSDGRLPGPGVGVHVDGHVTTPIEQPGALHEGHVLDPAPGLPDHAVPGVGVERDGPPLPGLDVLQDVTGIPLVRPPTGPAPGSPVGDDGLDEAVTADAELAAVPTSPGASGGPGADDPGSGPVDPGEPGADSDVEGPSAGPVLVDDDGGDDGGRDDHDYGDDGDHPSAVAAQQRDVDEAEGAGEKGSNRARKGDQGRQGERKGGKGVGNGGLSDFESEDDESDQRTGSGKDDSKNDKKDDSKNDLKSDKKAEQEDD